MTDKIKLGAAAVLVAVGIWGYYWLADSALLLRILAVVAGILAGAAVAWMSEPGRRFAVFAGEAIEEVKKVVWPTPRCSRARRSRRSRRLSGRRARKRCRRPRRYSHSW